MGLCKKCYKRFPPDFMSELKDDDLECVFCKSDKKELTIIDKNGTLRKYTKEDCVKEYELFLKMVKASQSVSKILETANDVVK